MDISYRKYASLAQLAKGPDKVQLELKKIPQFAIKRLYLTQ